MFKDYKIKINYNEFKIWEIIKDINFINGLGTSSFREISILKSLKNKNIVSLKEILLSPKQVYKINNKKY